MVRHKNRYFLVEINPTETKYADRLKLDPPAIYNAIILKMEQLHGDFGIAAIRAGFTTKYCNELTRIAIIRTRHGPHKLVASVLPFISKVQDISVSIRSLYTGATLMQCFKYLKTYQLRKLDEICANNLSVEDQEMVRKELLDFKFISQTV